MSDLCVNPKGTVYYYVNSQPVLKNTGKIFSIFFFFLIALSLSLFLINWPFPPWRDMIQGWYFKEKLYSNHT